jgi:pilus assembly protein CpaF
VRVTVHFVDGEELEGDSDAVSLEHIGFPLKLGAGTNASNVYLSLVAIKYVAINPLAGDVSEEGDPRVGLPKVVLHFLDGETMHTYKDEYFGQQSEGYNVRLWDPKKRALVRVMVSMHALKGVFFVESFDSRTEEDKRANATRRRTGKTEEEVPTAWLTDDGNQEVDPETRRLARAYQRRLALERDLDLGGDPIVFEKAITQRLDHLLDEDLVAVSPEQRTQMVGIIMREAVGFGPLDSLLHDETITEIMVNAADEIYIEREGKMLRSKVKFDDISQMMNVIRRMAATVGRRVDESSPMVDARLPDGSRFNAVIPPAAIRGPAITIRKFSSYRLGLDDLIKVGTMSPAMGTFLQDVVKGKLSLMVSGGTGSGKTTTLNVLGSMIPHKERVVTIEDSAELQMGHPHLVAMEFRPANVEGRGELTIRQLLRNSLRMRPDRVIVGEVRDAAALDMLQAMNTGHDGSMSTIHSNTAKDAFSRLETMVLSGSVELPLAAVRAQIASAINVVIHQGRMPDGSRKIIQISEMVGYKDDQPVLNDIFRLQRSPSGDVTFVATGNIPTHLAKMEMSGVYTDQAIFSSDPYHVESKKIQATLGEMPVEDVAEAVAELPAPGEMPPAEDIHVEVPIDPTPVRTDPIVITAPPYDPALDAPPAPVDGAAAEPAPEEEPEAAPTKPRSLSVGSLIGRRQSNRSKPGGSPQK